MKDELQAKLVEILTSIQAATGRAADFALEQLPDIAQSYVAYGRAWWTLLAALGIALTATSATVALRLGWRNTRAVYSHGVWTDGRCAAAFFGTGATAAGAVLTLVALHQAALVWFAPKVWLLKELAGLVSRGR